MSIQCCSGVILFYFIRFCDRWLIDWLIVILWEFWGVLLRHSFWPLLVQYAAWLLFLWFSEGFRLSCCRGFRAERLISGCTFRLVHSTVKKSRFKILIEEEWCVNQSINHRIINQSINHQSSTITTLHHHHKIITER